MSNEGVDAIQVVKVGRAVDAETWAIYQGIEIAKKHIPNGSFEQQDALCADIAEALTRTRRVFERSPEPTP